MSLGLFQIGENLRLYCLLFLTAVDTSYARMMTNFRVHSFPVLLVFGRLLLSEEWTLVPERRGEFASHRQTETEPKLIY